MATLESKFPEYGPVVVKVVCAVCANAKPIAIIRRDDAGALRLVYEAHGRHAIGDESSGRGSVVHATLLRTTSGTRIASCRRHGARELDPSSWAEIAGSAAVGKPKIVSA